MLCYLRRGDEAGVSRMLPALRLIGVGFFIAGSILLGVVAGLWLDDRFNTSPVLVIIGLLAGITVAFYGVYRMLQPLFGDKRNKGNH